MVTLQTILGEIEAFDVTEAFNHASAFLADIKKFMVCIKVVKRSKQNKKLAEQNGTKKKKNVDEVNNIWNKICI